jgi:hypothetical protein
VLYASVYSTQPHHPSFVIVTEKSRRWGRTVVHTVGSGKHLRQRSWRTTGFLPQLEGPHARRCDERQRDNKHRFALLSTRRLQHKQVEAPYPGSPSSPGFSEIPFIHSENFDLRLSPTETQLPPRGPDAECGTTWVHTTVGVYASVRLQVVPPPSSLFKFIRPVARWMWS